MPKNSQLMVRQQGPRIPNRPTILVYILPRNTETRDSRKKASRFRILEIRSNKKRTRKLGPSPGQRPGSGPPPRPAAGGVAAAACIAGRRRRRGRGRRWRARLWQRRQTPEEGRPWRRRGRGDQGRGLRWLHRHRHRHFFAVRERVFKLLCCPWVSWGAYF